MDDDLEAMSRIELIAEIRKLRHGIRKHRDGTRHELCWHHPDLWALLPERTDPVPTVPSWPQFLRGCIRYRQSLDEQLPDAPRSDVPYEGPPADSRDHGVRNAMCRRSPGARRITAQAARSRPST
jgi:hypothetical protein